MNSNSRKQLVTQIINACAITDKTIAEDFNNEEEVAFDEEVQQTLDMEERLHIDESKDDNIEETNIEDEQ